MSQRAVIPEKSGIQEFVVADQSQFKQANKQPLIAIDNLLLEDSQEELTD